MTRRERIGSRRYRATATQHDGTQDAAGNPTYTTAGDWDTVVTAWPCEILTTTGSEMIRGRQVTAGTTHVMFGDYHYGSTITPDMRVTVGGVVYDVVAAYDPDGDRRELRVEAKRES